jgi:exodeoxyribonuclease VIII
MFGATGLGDTFYAPVLLQSCVDVGLTIDASTVLWWMRQSDEARSAAFRSDAAPLPEVLLDFTVWFTEQRAKHPWCHGSTCRSSKRPSRLAGS